ncbi:hypothetical protein BpHYR1_028578 [Brachionus plicatilis]|uniref:Uncharacterized protein n=1 Tax=Brachionus plicatilis TaxID=10195 RepID=A0A3M7QSX0_BRAPC|nr:hypothetical protein BpHYR1_028578 [Brachionus plicatilis]
MILMFKWEKAFIQAFMDIEARIDEFNSQKPKKDHNFRISDLNTVDRIIYCASRDSLLCKLMFRKDQLIICMIGQVNLTLVHLLMHHPLVCKMITINEKIMSINLV